MQFFRWAAWWFAGLAFYVSAYLIYRDQLGREFNWTDLLWFIAIAVLLGFDTDCKRQASKYPWLKISLVKRSKERI